MKVFVFWAKWPNKDNGKWQMLRLLKQFDDLMANEAEILVDDQFTSAALTQKYLKAVKYKKVTVCVAGGKNWTKFNLGKWDELHFSVHGWGSTFYSSGIERDFGAIERADTGLAIWDGNDFNTFANMLCFCVLGKPVRLYLINEDRWIDVNSIDDIREFMGPDEKLTEDEICEVMTCCNAPDAIIKYILNEDEQVYQMLLDCINQADISLEKKLELLKSLLAKQNMNYEVFCAVERAVKLGKNWKIIKHDVRAIADLRPVGYGKAEIPWKEIRHNWRELDKIVNPRKYAKYFLLGGKTITFE